MYSFLFVLKLKNKMAIVNSYYINIIENSLVIWKREVLKNDPL